MKSKLVDDFGTCFHFQCGILLVVLLGQFSSRQPPLPLNSHFKMCSHHSLADRRTNTHHILSHTPHSLAHTDHSLAHTTLTRTCMPCLERAHPYHNTRMHALPRLNKHIHTKQHTHAHACRAHIPQHACAHTCYASNTPNTTRMHALPHPNTQIESAHIRTHTRATRTYL